MTAAAADVGHAAGLAGSTQGPGEADMRRRRLGPAREEMEGPS